MSMKKGQRVLVTWLRAVPHFPGNDRGTATVKVATGTYITLEFDHEKGEDYQFERDPKRVGEWYEINNRGDNVKIEVIK